MTDRPGLLIISHFTPIVADSESLFPSPLQPSLTAELLSMHVIVELTGHRHVLNITTLKLPGSSSENVDGFCCSSLERARQVFHGRLIRWADLVC